MAAKVCRISDFEMLGCRCGISDLVISDFEMADADVGFLI